MLIPWMVCISGRFPYTYLNGTGKGKAICWCVGAMILLSPVPQFRREIEIYNDSIWVTYYIYMCKCSSPVFGKGVVQPSNGVSGQRASYGLKHQHLTLRLDPNWSKEAVAKRAGDPKWLESARGAHEGVVQCRWQKCTAVCTHAHMYSICIHTYSHTYVHTYIHAYIHVCMHTERDTYIINYNHIHTYNYTHTHTVRTHTHT